MARNKDKMQRAKNRSKDEFYTLYHVISDEMIYYIEHFKNKVIYCNTDDMNSNFWKYFDDNFEKLGLKKIIATKYNKDGNGEKYELEIIDGKKIYKAEALKDNGDFRNQECIEILKEADIVVTNPPFSLFREFIKILYDYDKKFIILGNQNAITFKNVYPLIQNNKLWLGVSIHSGYREFMIPKDYKKETDTFRIDEYGNKYICIAGVRWFTNLDHKYQYEKLILTKKYDEKEYPKYDNCDAINVNKTKDIPCDYDGVMGVPITFLDKYNPEQFEIVRFRCGDDGKDVRINGKRPYFRILIKRKEDDKHGEKES